MKMTRVILSGLLTLILCFQAGCSTYLARGGSLEKRAGIDLIDPNDGPYSIEVIQRNNGERDYFWDIESKIVQENTCRIKYHKLYSTTGFMVVEAEVVNSKTRYPVVLDTGASQAVFVKVIHILENKLSIYPMETGRVDLNGYRLGLCHLPKLRIGNATLANWPCLYLEPNTNISLLGLSIAKDNSKGNVILVGLPAMRTFKYIMFDSISREAQLSLNNVFDPNEWDLWERYPFSIEEDFHGNAFLFVELPIAGKQTELQLDTGSARGLAVSEGLWKQMQPKIHTGTMRKGNELYPYIGRLQCRRGVIPKLEVGHRTVENAMISIFPNDSPLVEDCQGLLGMQYFQNTVMVLDFERNLMWINHL